MLIVHHLCNRFAIDWEQSVLHTAKWASSACAHELRRGIYMSALGDSMLNDVESWVPYEVFGCSLKVGAVFTVSGVMLFDDSHEGAHFAPVSNVAF